MNAGERRIVGKKHSRSLSYIPLEGKEVQLVMPHRGLKDTWFINPIRKDGSVAGDRWYVHVEDLLATNNQQRLSNMKGEIEV